MLVLDLFLMYGMIHLHNKISINITQCNNANPHKWWMTRAFKKPLQRTLFINSNISQLNLVATLEQVNKTQRVCVVYLQLLVNMSVYTTHILTQQKKLTIFFFQILFPNGIRHHFCVTIATTKCHIYFNNIIGLLSWLGIMNVWMFDMIKLGNWVMFFIFKIYFTIRSHRTNVCIFF